MAELPSGTVTFLFTDLEGSTRLWEDHPDAMQPALARHDAIVSDAIAAHDGHVVKATGDGFHAAFRTAQDALGAALDAQQALANEAWQETGPLLVRMGVHTGETQERDGDYFGSAVNRAARVMAVAHGGQILCSRATVEVAGEGFPARSLGEHRLRDLGAPQELFQVGDGVFPPLRSVDVVPTNLPTVLTDLIGRAEDVERIAGLVETERLVTLTGVGGVGKTRLALAAAAASTTSFPDGVWFVELAPANSPDEVVRTAAVAMGSAATDRAGLANYLSDRRALIVLDNCEHVLSAAAALAEAILVAGPEAAIVATSREPLGVDGETVRGVRSLAVPEADADDVEVAASSAVRLFVERASAATDSFALSDTNTSAVVTICSQLDGIPLAIELAAARVRAMPPPEIARRLGERFRLLSSGRGAHERHRTLQATVSWSHDLLDATEQLVFRRLAVFPSSFDLDAAEAVAGDLDADVIDALVRLVEQSLVEYDATTGRYRLLETLRQYAADRLADAGETDLARDRHIAFFLTLAADLACPGEFPDAASVDRIDAEMDNLHAVADWLAAQDRWRELLGLGRHLFEFVYSNDPVVAYRWHRDALAHDPAIDAQERIDALGELEWLKTLAGESEDDVEPGSSIAMADDAGLLHSPWAWSARVVALNSGDDPPAARAAAETMLAVADERGNRQAALQALGQLACAVAALGELAESAELAAETLRRGRLNSSPKAIRGAVTAAAGSYLTNRIEPDFEAGMQVLEADPLDPGSFHPAERGWLERMWGLAHLGLGHADLAVQYLTASLRAFDRGMPGTVQDAALALTVALYEAGEPALAARLDGYARAHLVTHTMLDVSHIWLRARLAAAEATLDPAERAAAHEAGARLDRRGFMRLLVDAENSVDPLRTRAVDAEENR